MLKKLFALTFTLFITACGHGGVTGGADPNNTGANSVAITGTGTYLISGAVNGATTGTTTVTLAPASGVAVTTTADTAGAFSFALPTVGNYTITPTNPNYTFNPSSSSISVTPTTTGRAGITFSSVSSYTISGTVTGAATQGVVVLLYSSGGGAPKSVATDANGYFAFTNLSNGSYTAIPSLNGHTFSPANAVITVNGANLTGNNFVAATASTTTAPATNVSISGTVTGAVAQGVNVLLYSAAGGAPISVTTDANGYFSFTNLSNGSYTAIPSLNGYTFSPANAVITVNGANLTGNNFVASTVSTATTANSSISGTVTGAVKQGVTMLLYNATTGASTSATTDVNGFYIFSGLSNNNYIVIPSMVGYSFGPANANITISGTNSTGNNFTATVGTVTAGTFSLAGTVSGAVKQGVTVLLHNPNSATPMTAVTDVNGYYSFNGLSAGSYTAIPTLTGYTFTPANNIVNITTANVTGNNYVSVGAAMNNLSGIITGDVKQGVTINLYGSTNATTTTDANGFYSFSGLLNGSYTVIPSYVGATFSPLNLVATMNGNPSTSNDFTSTMTLHDIKGSVGNLLSGVSMILSGAVATTTTTDVFGAYTFAGMPDGSYTVTPSLAGYTFNPTSSTVTLNGANTAGVNFTPTYIIIPTYTLSGHITNRKGLAGNTITLSGASAATTITDSTGYYQFTGLVAGTYTVTPSSNAAGVTYNPLASTIDLKANGTLDFTGFDTINVSVTANQINYDVKTALIAAGWDGVTKIYGNITINAGVTIYSNTVSIPALSLTGVFPADSRITITNNGTIVGATGIGGVGGVSTQVYDTNIWGFVGAIVAGGDGGNGGVGLYINSSSINYISNNHIISGGYGGGGGGGGGTYSVAYCGGTNGANGNGANGGSGATSCTGDGRYWGGAGGAGGNPSASGIGSAGAGSTWGAAGGRGGNAGPATSGAANANWTAIGTIYGAQN